MLTNRPLEKIICAILLFGFLIFLLPAYLSICQEKINNKRISDLAQIKGSLERYNNKSTFFPPLNNNTNPTDHCVTTQGLSTIALDPGNDFSPLLSSQDNKTNNSYCATNIKTFTTKNKKHIGANGFYLETNLKGSGESSDGFDNTMGRNFRYKQYTDHGILKYRICGGDEKSCGDVSLNS